MSSVRMSLTALFLMLVALPFHRAVPHANAHVGPDPFAIFWESSWRSDSHSMPVNAVSGVIPTWLRGSLIRNGGGAFETKARNVTYAFDGFAKLFAFGISGEGNVSYQERFLDTNFYQYVQKHQDLPKTPMMGAPQPRFPPMKLPAPANMSDNTNIQVWQLSNPDKAYATTDSTRVQSFSPKTLETLGLLHFEDDILKDDGKLQLSCSHPQSDPSSNGSVLINVATKMLELGKHKLQVFRMGSDNVRVPFGTSYLPYMPYIHSFHITQSKVVVTASPVGFEVPCILMFEPLISCMKWHDQNATMFVFSLNSTNETAIPIATMSAAKHFSLHTVNAYDLDEQTLIMESITYETSTFSSKYQHAELSAMKDPVKRDQVDKWGLLRQWHLSVGTPTLLPPTPASVSYVDVPLRDAEGYVWRVDFPFVNPLKNTKRHRYVYAVAPYARNSSRYEDMALVKIDVHAPPGVPAVTSYFNLAHYPSEPVFVPRPGSTVEDDGVVLSQVVDGENKTTYMLVLQASSMKVVATARLSAGEVTPYTQHGLWFQEPQEDAAWL